MSNLSASARLAGIGWRGDAAVEAEVARGRVLARVVAQHRAGYELHDGERTFGAQPAAPFLKRGLDPAARPAVGDFVLVEPGKPARIVAFLPRRSVLTRAAAGERYERQLIATNVDYAFVLMGLDQDYNPRRLERYLLLIEGSGAQGVVVLTKADKYPQVDAVLTELATRLPAGTPVHAINAKDPASVAVLAQYLKPGDTAVLVGSSGVGKSTLTNTLLGEARMATAATRAHDGRGRHTTTHRALLTLPSGGCLIDTPGMRELKLTGEENLELFADVETLTTQCRFSDCAHGNEPGCAVRAALDVGELSAERWQSYLKLRDEREQQAAALEERLKRKADAKVANKALGRHQRHKRGPF